MFKKRLKLKNIVVRTYKNGEHTYKGFKYYIYKNCLYIYNSDNVIVAIYPASAFFEIINLDIQ